MSTPSYTIILIDELRYHRENPGRDVIMPVGTVLEAIPPALWNKEQREYAKREQQRWQTDVHFCWWPEGRGEWHAVEARHAEVKNIDVSRIAAAVATSVAPAGRDSTGGEQQPELFPERPSFAPPSTLPGASGARSPIRLRIGPDTRSTDP